MNMYESPFAPMSVLNEKIARQLFNSLPENDMVFLITDRNNNRWPSNSEAFAELNVDDGYLNLILEKIDDGDEPVISQTEDYTLIASALNTDRTCCGYIIIFMKQSNPEQAIVNIDLLETIISQVNLIASLVEKNSLLYELQYKNQASSLEYAENSFTLN